MSYQVRGIDVYNGNSNVAPIDWAKVKVTQAFALLKASYGSPNPKQVDCSFERNYSECKRVSLPVGAYHFLYARDVATAKIEAQFFLDTIKGKQFEYPVFLDIEDDNGSLGGLSKQQLTDIVLAWLTYVQSAGYYVMWYASADWRKNRLDMSRLSGFDSMLACYDGNTPDTADYSKDCGIWQYSCKGVVDGITNHYVDMDVAYKDYPTMIKASGLNGWGNQPTPTSIDVYYRVRTNSRWLPEVCNLNDYAGIQGAAITDVAVRVSGGTVKYRVHNKGGSWLPYVTGCNINDSNGYAGNGQLIDAIEIYYSTPDSIRPCKCAKYHVSPCNGNYYSWQYDNKTDNGQDGYAGSFGNTIDRLQIVIE